MEITLLCDGVPSDEELFTHKNFPVPIFMDRLYLASIVSVATVHLILVAMNIFSKRYLLTNGIKYELMSLMVVSNRVH